MTAIVAEPVHPGAISLAAPHRRIADRPGAAPGPAVAGWRWSTLLAGAAELLALVWSVPIVVLLVGTPFALAIVALLRLARLALNQF